MYTKYCVDPFGYSVMMLTSMRRFEDPRTPRRLAQDSGEMIASRPRHAAISAVRGYLDLNYFIFVT